MIKVINDSTFNVQIQTLIEFLNIRVTEPLEFHLNHMPNTRDLIIDRNQNRIDITYHKKHQVFEAFGYVLSHLKDNEYSHKIERSANRLGLMLDAARNAVPKISTLKQYVMYLSLLGYDYLEIYVEDVLEVFDEPLFGYMRGKYSIEEIQTLDQFASDFGIELIPCIQTLAHLERIFMHEPYGEILDIQDILLVGHERTYQLIDNILKTTRKAFKSNFINIGMDEAWNLGVGKYLAQNGYQNKTEIMKRHLDEVLKLTRKHQYLPSMWADMFFQLTGSNYHQAEVTITKDIQSIVPKDVTLIYWDYYRTDLKGYQAKHHTIQGITDNYAFAGGAWKWMGFAPNNHYTYRSMKPAIKAFKANNTKDFLVTAWGDDGAEASHFSIVAPLAWIANELLISPRKNSELDPLLRLLTNYTFKELNMMDLPNMLYDTKDVLPNNPSKYLFYEDILFGSRYYKVNLNYESMYKKYTKKLRQLAKKDSPLNYLFKTLYQLSSVLEIKSTLGVKTLIAYRNKDQIMMQSNLKDIETAIKRMKVFYNTFKDQWHQENKTLGFEVQTHRIGGTILRLEAVYADLKHWLENPNTKILALEERPDYEAPTDLYNGTIGHNYVTKYITYSKV